MGNNALYGLPRLGIAQCQNTSNHSDQKVLASNLKALLFSLQLQSNTFRTALLISLLQDIFQG